MKRGIFLKTSMRYGHLLLISIVMTFLLSAVVIRGNALIADAVDKLLAEREVAISNFLWMLLAFTVVGAIASFLKTYTSSLFGIRVQREFKNLTAQKMPKLEYAFFDDQGSGAIVNKLISDIAETGRFFAETLPGFCTVIITIVTAMIYIASINYKLLFVVLICYPLLLVVANHIAKLLVELAKKRRGKLDLMAAIASDSIQGIAVGRSYNLYEIIRKKLDAAIDDILKNEYQRTTLSSGSYILQQMISWIPNIICSVYVLYQTFSGEVSVGQMMAFLVILNRLIHPMGELPFIINDAREINVSIQRLQDIFRQPEEKNGTFGMPEEVASAHESCDIALCLSNIEFAYEEEGRKIFQGLSVNIPKGKTVAFAGGSGQGKTTVFKLLCGFYRPNRGTYSLYGRPFEQWNIQAAREQFALVSQSVFLFPETIFENVSYGKVGATRDEVIEACKNANIHDFIMNLPMQYETMVGERGVRLSGGERQRISIARAFLKNAPILLLDEPTSAIDVGTEQLIQQAIDTISKDKTVIVIAHRLSTIEHADMICMFDQGKILEEGTHDELLAEKGLYYALYNSEEKMAQEDREALMAQLQGGVTYEA